MNIRKVVGQKWLYLMLLPPVAYFVIFKYGPMFGALIAFQDYNIVKGVSGSHWVGLKHFREFLGDPYFWKLVRNTVLLNLYLLLFFFPAPIVLALMINEARGKLFKRFTQSVSYLPHFLSSVVVCGMVVNFLSTDGMINRIVVAFGGEPVSFLMKAEWFRTIFVSMEIWQGIGWGSIIYIAALAGIDPGLYEAARVDGANRWQQIRHVTLPGIVPVIVIMLLLNIGDIMSVGFEKILLLYTGSTYETADVIATFVYRRGILGNDFSFATAVELFQLVIAIVFISVANRVARKTGETSLW